MYVTVICNNFRGLQGEQLGIIRPACLFRELNHIKQTEYF